MQIRATCRRDPAGLDDGIGDTFSYGEQETTFGITPMWSLELMVDPSRSETQTCTI